MRRAARTAALVGSLVVLLAAPAAAQQPSAVQGGGSSVDAPRLAPGTYADLIGEPETLWYEIEARQGQQVAATVVLRGRPEGPTAASSELRVTVLDAQLQISAEPVAQPFNGNVDTQIQVVGEPLPEIGIEGAYLTVQLASPTGANDLRDLGYQLEFATAVGGEAIPLTETVTAVPEPAFDPGPTGPETVAPSAADLLPVGLFALALGGAGGYELTRRRLRRR